MLIIIYVWPLAIFPHKKRYLKMDLTAGLSGI